MILHSSFAEGIENAAIVCCFMSPDYEKSENCQFELQYAHKRGKRVILLVLCDTQSWKPCSWLESMMKDFESIKYDKDCLSDVELGAGWLVHQMQQKPAITQLMRSSPAKQPSYLCELVKHEYNPCKYFSKENASRAFTSFGDVRV